jgi:hypothetical protein
MQMQLIHTDVMTAPSDLRTPYSCPVKPQGKEVTPGKIECSDIQELAEYKALKNFFRCQTLLGGDRAPVQWRILHAIICVLSIPSLLWTGAMSEYNENVKLIHEEGHDPAVDTFNRMWAILCVLVGMNTCHVFWCQAKALGSQIEYADEKSRGYGEVVTSGHMMRLCCELAAIEHAACCRRQPNAISTWLKQGLYAGMIPAVLFGVQGIFWTSWLVEVCQTSGYLEGVAWVVFEIFVLPAIAMHLTFFMITVGVSNAVVKHHCLQISERIQTAIKTGFASEQEIDALVNDVMDQLRDLNTNLIPALSLGWGNPIATTSSLCFAAGIGYLWRLFNINYGTYGNSVRMTDTLTSCALMLLGAFILLFPATTSSACVAVTFSLSYSVKHRSELSYFLPPGTI